MPHSVAIVTRTRDRPLLLKRALACVAAQTFSDYELVIVNDGGDPEPVDALVSAHRLDGQVTVVHNPESVGREQAVNVGAAAAASTYLAVLDDDDTWAPEFLEATVGYLEGHPDDAAVATRTQVVYEEIVDDEVIERGRQVLKADSSEITLFEMLLGNYAPPSSMLIRRPDFERLGGWDGTMPVLADWDFNLRLLLDSSVGFVDGAPLAFWHRRENQDGPLGNSVHAAAALHRRYTQEISDRYLRSYLETGHGIGPLLLQAEVLRQLKLHEDWSRSVVLDRVDHNFGILDGRMHRVGEDLAELRRTVDALAVQVQTLTEDSRARDDRSLRGLMRRARARLRPEDRSNPAGQMEHD